ncbi:MAG: rRNA maturation RNase YbeY [Alkalispirochaeta sp.]
MNTVKTDHPNEVEVRSENLEPPSWVSAVERYALAVLRRLERSGWVLSILLADDEFVHRLNREYRGIDSVTDVLSFAGNEDSDPAPDSPVDSSGVTRMQPPRYVGDIVLALPFIRTQAEEYHVPFEEEIRRLIVHGILHLAGYTHSSYDFDAEPMLRLQEHLVSEIKETLF